MASRHPAYDTDDIYELKQWIRQNLPPSRHGLPLPNRLKLELEDLGFQSIRLRQIGQHPVWAFNCRIGTSKYNSDWIIDVALHRMASQMGFRAKMREIVVHIAGDRIIGAICLDDGVRSEVPEIPVGDDDLAE